MKWDELTSPELPRGATPDAGVLPVAATARQAAAAKGKTGEETVLTVLEERIATLEGAERPQPSPTTT